jgi:opacity protein-like surface antigen
MKKFILLGLMVLFGLPLAAYAAPVGGPPGQGLTIGLGQEGVFDRDLKPSAIVSPVAIGTINGRPGCNIRHMYRTMLHVGYGIFDFLEVYVKLGGADYKFRSDIEDQFGNPTGDVKVNTKWGFAYGAGLKGAYAFKNGLLVGADVQYLRHRQKFRATGTDFTGLEETSTGKVTFQEWQFGPFVGYKIMKFLPYVGVKYSDVRLKFSEGGETTKFKADDHVGAFVGLTYDIIPQVKLNLEGRFIDETGLNFNVIFKF